MLDTCNAYSGAFLAFTDALFLSLACITTNIVGYFGWLVLVDLASIWRCLVGFGGAGKAKRPGAV